MNFDRRLESMSGTGQEELEPTTTTTPPLLSLHSMLLSQSRRQSSICVEPSESDALCSPRREHDGSME